LHWVDQRHLWRTVAQKRRFEQTAFWLILLRQFRHTSAENENPTLKAGFTETMPRRVRRVPDP
jgi:hypothetical protein